MIYSCRQCGVFSCFRRKKLRAMPTAGLFVRIDIDRNSDDGAVPEGAVKVACRQPRSAREVRGANFFFDEPGAERLHLGGPKLHLSRRFIAKQAGSVKL